MVPTIMQICGEGGRDSRNKHISKTSIPSATKFDMLILHRKGANHIKRIFLIWFRFQDNKLNSVYAIERLVMFCIVCDVTQQWDKSISTRYTVYVSSTLNNILNSRTDCSVSCH